MSSAPTPPGDIDTASLFASREVARSRMFSRLWDRLASVFIAAGGLGVIAAVLLIAFYLVHEVLPLFEPASAVAGETYPLPMVDAGASLVLATDGQGQIGFRLAANGTVVFFELAGGEVLSTEALPLTEEQAITSVALDAAAPDNIALGLADGGVLLLRTVYQVSYSTGFRVSTPQIEFPLGERAIPMTDGGAVVSLAVDYGEDELLVLAQGRGIVDGVAISLHGMSQKDSSNYRRITLDYPGAGPIRRMLISSDHHWLHLLDSRGALQHLQFDENGGYEKVSVQRAASAPLLDIAWLSGAQSILSLDGDGGISQRMLLKPADGGVAGYSLEAVRHFDAGEQHQQSLLVEQERKGFITLDELGQVRFFHVTAGQQVLSQAISDKPVQAIALSPRGNLLLVESSDGTIATWTVSNEHPEISLDVLWGKIWYEGYGQPEYLWQSSSADGDFEAKLSLVPLVFGTLKAALYAMLIATPLALCGAIFTAYFMAPAMRQRVKPLVELMEALPTVILGFLAGLWLAPLLERHMITVLLGLLALPVVSLAVAFALHCLPGSLAARVANGWQAALLVPVIVLTAWLCYLAAPGVESWAFQGDFMTWLTGDLGVGFNQRNALVIGIAMGFAIIPTVFSIAEDAIFSVPRQLPMGALALGASPWQAMIGVVLPAASPGIFSALMIGFGRAVGETMIVLMATGNTPIMDANIFEGMRTLAANIAVEVPEAAVDSTHYRVLFLAGLLLFAFTFLVNTAAELMRQRLRNKYGTL